MIVEPLRRTWTEAEAFAYCSGLTAGHYENFPVGSVLMPAALRPDVHSLYAFMRTADDFSDEDRRAGDEEERLAWLMAWDRMLDEAVQGKARHPVFIALAVTLKRHPLPVQWLKDLLSAFTQDVTKRRYATRDDVLDYCRRSANPVGRLILTLFGYRDEALYRLSDAICTGLQLANHWQDVAVDLKKDRIYLPEEDMARFGVSVEKHGPPLTIRGGDSLKNLMADEVKWARTFFERGQSLPERVSGRLRFELRFTWRGGMRILEKIERQGYDVFRQRPVVTLLDWIGIAVRSLF